ncbi:MAG: saccharopine dehydrogenase NADP-binding domain-containing protein [Bdellovibrionales bacterium]|nr:saccharopine dehydrogenase NADP-binding domain-containing protein [Bdellovibrionales bacterium]
MWMLYGVNGYTGQLLLEEALARGHRPIVAGRSREPVEALARKHGLTARVFALDDPKAVAARLREAGVMLVLHAAGPFARTADPMMRACIEAGAHYLDITGEVSVFERAAELSSEAKRAGVALMPGVGFDVVPSDCLAAHVASRVRSPVGLEIAFSSGAGSSPGTAKTIVESIPQGTLARRSGKLVRLRTGFGSKRVRFLDRERVVTPVLWGDLSTAFRSTGVPDITTYTVLPRAARIGLAAFSFPLRVAFSFPTLRRSAQEWIGRNVAGPDAETRARARSQFWARAWNAAGESAEARLETPEGYRLTALTGIRAVEGLIGGGQGGRGVAPSRLTGTLTPAQAFGSDFILSMPDTRREG